MRVKKLLRRTLCMLLSACTLLSFACACDDSVPDDSNKPTTVSYYTGRGVHRTSIKERSDYLVQNNRTDYKILLPAEALPYEEEAAALIAEYLEKGTEAKIEIVYDDADGVTANGKYISVGDTTLMRQSGISISFDEFGNSGYKIVTKKDVIYLSGSRSPQRQGTLYAAQKFLYYTMNLRAYAQDEIKFNFADNVKMRDFDVTEIPEFDNRRISFKSVYTNGAASKWLQLSISKEDEIPDFSGHSYFTVLPPAVYYNEHPEWYSHKTGLSPDEDERFNRNAQLCFSNEEMTEEFIKQLTVFFQKYPDRNFAHIGVMDSMHACNCENCARIQLDYGTNNAGVQCMFVNKVARGVTENIQKIWPDRELTFEIFAYNSYFVPPASADASGNYVPDCPEVVLDDNVMVQFTPISQVLSEAITEPANQEIYGYLQGWKSVCNQISTWCYGTNFSNLLITHKDWDTFVENALVFSQNGVERFYLQACFSQYEQAWEELKLYVGSRLLWDINQDYDALAEEFIENYYGEAAGKVQEMWDVMTTYQEYANTELKMSGSLYMSLIDPEKKFWHLSYVEATRKLLDEAFEAIAPLKETDPGRYQVYTTRLQRLKIENLFMQLEFHIGNYATEHVKASVEEFSALCSKFGITHMDESKTMPLTSFIQKWRANYE